MGLITAIRQKFQKLMPWWTAGEDLRSQQHALLRVLATAKAEGLDPNRLIANLSSEYPDSYGSRLESLRRWIAAESSIAVALAHTPGALNEEDSLAIQCAVETDSLDQTYRYLVDAQDNHRAESNSLNSEETTSLFSSLAYISCVFLFVALVAVFFMIWIAPTFIQIFDDFGTELPSAMVGLVEFVNGAWLVILVGLMLFAALMMALQFEDVGRTFARSWLGKRLTFSNHLNSAGVLRLLAIATQGGQPVDSVLTAAAHHHPDRRFRKDLLKVRTESDSDAEIWRNLAAQRILTKNERLQIEQLENPSLRSWALEFIAENRRQLARQRTGLVLRIAQYLPILILSVLIGWIVVAVIQTLTEMITSLT